MRKTDHSRSTSRGRPSICLSDRLRVAFWSNSVLQASGLTEIRELEWLLNEQNGLGISSGLWSRYMRGKVLPQGSLGEGRRKAMVFRVEEIFPGTAELFYFPIWRFLEWNSQVDFEHVRDGYLWLDRKVAARFVSSDYVYPSSVKRPLSGFWHIKIKPDDRLTLLSELDLWDRLLLCLLESRMSYAAQNIAPFVHNQLLAAMTLAELASKEEFHTKRLRSTFLAMEGLCLIPLMLNVEAAEDVRSTVDQQYRDYLENWRLRFGGHLRTLSENSILGLLDWINEGQQVLRGNQDKQ